MYYVYAVVGTFKNGLREMVISGPKEKVANMVERYNLRETCVHVGEITTAKPVTGQAAIEKALLGV